MMAMGKTTDPGGRRIIEKINRREEIGGPRASSWEKGPLVNGVFQGQKNPGNGPTLAYSSILASDGGASGGGTGYGQSDPGRMMASQDQGVDFKGSAEREDTALANDDELRRKQAAGVS